ncbi:unnamed protein product [Moneuplotes crassus]|uniref:Uncharacterized protein n=2 Tax=Euplotes crassus TaxID=5936 RepID=A0AAD1UEV4_EUPCR|nr:unnamed protein product [Moneuplotes crassus]
MNSKFTGDHGSSSPTHSGNHLGESSHKKKGRSNYEPSYKGEQDWRPADYKLLADDEEEKLRKQKEINSKLNDDFKRRQARYLKREQEYRRHIEDLQRELRIRLGYEVDATDKNFKVIQALRDELHSNIDGIQDKIQNLKEEQENDIVRKFTVNKLKVEIENSKNTKGMSKEELKDRENQLNQHLEVITNIAQRIENENRTLMKKNSELRKEYQNQENDRELLLKQLVMLKKENGKIKEEIDYYDKIIEEKKEDDGEQIDLDRSPSKSSMSKKKGKNLMNSRKKNSKRNITNAESLRQSSGMGHIGQKTIGENFAASFGPGPQESEEDKIHRYERIIEKLKKNLEFERKNLKGARNQYQSEMNMKTELEEMLKECVQQVQKEIKKRNRDPKTAAINKIQKKGKKLNAIDNIEFTDHDRDRVIELLLSQERVLHLLYEKTFPSDEKQEVQEEEPVIRDEDPEGGFEEEDQEENEEENIEEISKKQEL